MNPQTEKTLLRSTANPAINQGFINTPEGQLHYWEAGSGPVLLLVHQSSSSAEEFAGLVPYLAESYRLLAWDWPGHGSSDDPGSEPGVEEYTNSAVAVLDHLNISEFHVVGHHGGALIAMNLAWKFPLKVNKIILSGTSGVRQKEAAEEFTQSLDLERRNTLDQDGKSLFEAWGRYVKYMPDSTPEEILIPFLSNMTNRLRPYDAHYGVLRWDRTPALESIKDRNILLIQGEHDEFVTHQETLLDMLPNSRRVVINNAGPFLFFESPREAATVISSYLAEQ